MVSVIVFVPVALRQDTLTAASAKAVSTAATNHFGRFDLGQKREALAREASTNQPARFAAPTQGRIAMFFFQEGFTYRNFLMDMIAIFVFVVWFWLLIVIYGDLFRRHDISGWGKALWVLALVLTSYFGIFAYLITQGRGMAERNAHQAQQARDELRRVVGFSVADEITKLDQLKKSGSITDAEYGRLRAKLV
jgi:hypothetical protein